MKGRYGYGRYKKRKLRKWENDGKQNSLVVSPEDPYHSRTAIVSDVNRGRWAWEIALHRCQSPPPWPPNTRLSLAHIVGWIPISHPSSVKSRSVAIVVA